VYNASNGNVVDSLIDVGGLVVDAIGVVIPVAPGVSSAAIASYRASKSLDTVVAKSADDVVDAAKGIDDGVMAGSVGATRVWPKKGRLNAIGLPTTGKIRFVPRKGYDPSSPLARGPNKGILDRFGNEWTKGPSRTKGQAFEWDVQLSKTGRQKLGWASRDGSHVNVSLDGRITHK
jgi:hypothetical protein